MSLTPTAIRSAKPGTTLYDDKTRGLHVRVTSKSRSFYLYFRTRSGIERRPKVGQWPVMSIEDARRVAKDWLFEVSAGRDPVAEWQKDRSEPTVEKLAELYAERHGARKKTGDEDTRMFEHYIIPRLGSRRVADVTRLDVERVHVLMKDTPYQANRVLALMSKAFSLAEAWGLRPQNSNPCHGISRYREARRRRYLKPAEMAAVFGALRAHAPERPQAVAFLTLLLFTGARPSEIAAAKWSQLHDNRIELDVHKTDGNGAPRVIFLPPQALEVLEMLPRTNGTICGIQSPRALWRQIVKEAGLVDVRMYDLRHSFASAGLAGDLTLAQIGELLGHRSAQTTLRYAHLMEERGVAAAGTAAGVLAAMRLPDTDRGEARSEDRPETSSSPLPK